MSGPDLMEQGLVVSIETKPGAAVIFYRKRPGSSTRWAGCN